MATQTLRQPNFSEDVAWVPSWLQNLRTDGFNEYVKESQDPSNHAEKDLAPSPEKGINVKDFNVLSREEGGYKSCHLFLSGGDSSSLSVAPSPGNVFQFSLHLSSDVDSLFCPTQDLYQSHHAAAPSKALTLQPAQTSVDLRENMHSVMGDHACEQDVMAAYIPETTKKDSLKSPVDTIGSVRQQKEKPKVECFKSDDISVAVELSIAASEALVIHDLVKTESVSETLSSAVLEIALRVKQARLEGSEDGFLSSSVESDCSDSLSDLNDFLMEDAYEDIGLSVGVFFEENVCKSAEFHAKGVSGDESYNGGSNKHDEREIPSQLTKFDDKSEQKKLEVNVETEVQQNTDSPPHSLCGERVMHSDDPGLGANTPKHFVNDYPTAHQYKEKNTNDLALNKTDGLAMADLTSIKTQNSVNSSPFQASENFKEERNENWATYLAPERFRSRWLGGWTYSSSLNQNNAKRIPKFHVKETSFLSESADIVSNENSCLLKHDPKCVRETSFLTESADIVLDERSRVLKHDPKCVRETSFLTESADIVPDESSCVLKHDPKRAISSQLSMHCEGSHNKPDEGVLHSQDMVGCSSLSLIDPLCSVVPCSFASEHDNYETHIGKENGTESFPPLISDFEVDNCEKISDKNTTLDCRDERIKSTLDGKDTPITATEMVEQMSDKLTRVELTSLKTYSMILPNQDVNQNCNLTPHQSIGVADASLGTRVSESPSASKHEDENRNEVNRRHLIDQKSIIQITDDKSDELKASEQTQEKRSPINLNHRTRHRLLGPKTAVNVISIEKNINQYGVPETFVQHQESNTLCKVQVECNKFPDGHVRVRKQVHFSDKVEELHQKRKLSKLESSHKRGSSIRAKRQRVSKSLTTSAPRTKHSLTCRSAVSELIFQGREFLLTGLSSYKERDLEALIRNSGGVILYDIPSPPNSKGKRSSTLSCSQLPIILCKRKLQSTKFLYGCAVGASILKVDWLTDCLASGTILPPEKYMILPNRDDMKWTRIGKAIHHRNQNHIFERVGIMLHGKHSFCTKFACIIKHGGGRAFKTLQWLVRSTDEERTLMGAIVVEEKATISRHLKSCALERDIPIMTSSWIIKSLYSGNLLPFTEEKNSFSLPFVQVPEVPNSFDMSEEI
ncbi:uncharacterized protein LOC123915806 isoform X2 [Trifolium pratense]|uniref:uncharacterized protein LOC123915806 isoform X2 n=1 Tax=Trifolium pratense TaxID=57577 RepID=UPI001E694DA1|nr:uncharacterized protein LOC123915806 isoform X2 [Trifolium pratense]